MNSANKKRIAIAAAITSLIALTGCGKNSDTPPPVGSVPAPLPGSLGCVPINAPIPFTATNIYFSGVSIVGGQVPGSSQMGQIIIGGGIEGGPYQRNGVDGTISMNVVPTNTTNTWNYPGTYPGGTYPGGSYPGGTYPGSYPGLQPTVQAPSAANATGFVSIAPMTQQDIMWKFGNGQFNGQPGYYNPLYPSMPQPVAPQTQACVSGIALNVGHYYNTIHSGNVYLYLNNTQHGYVLYF
ncbi:MAG: hypothetical protein AABZ06_02590 [Bdellovibrionota bacterium]